MDSKLSIKNMVCNRCIEAVKTILENLKIEYQSVQLGKAVLKKPPSPTEIEKLEPALTAGGFELLSDKRTLLIENIKTIIIQMVHHQDRPEKIGHLSVELPKNLNHSYVYLSSLFSEVEGTTIEKYLILQKIERAKELLSYGELNISEIAFQLNYSSSQYFSTQFKSITGSSPTDFCRNSHKKRKPLHDI